MHKEKIKVFFGLFLVLFILAGQAGSAPVIVAASMAAVPAQPAPKYLSHPPVRLVPPPSDRAMSKGPAYFADAERGNDANDGSKKAPWKTINHALKRLGPGDTLYLRGGSYFENVYCAASGTPEAPIMVRSYPGEQAVIDGGIPEFQQSPETAWQPYPKGGPGEYVSTRPYRNIRDVVGLFGDSNVGLQTYWHAMDLRAENELWIPDEETMVKPVYCGPGLWYDRQTGHIHVRLAHTHIQNPEVANYRGETDPRKLPLVVAPFQSTPLFVDLGRHVRFQDLVFRGGGYKTVNLLFGVGIEFENCTIFCGTYGIWSKNTGPLKMTNCGVYGNIPPWAFMAENALHTYTPRYHDPFLRDTVSKYAPPPYLPRVKGNFIYQKAPYAEALKARNIARLNTHAVLVTEGGYEFETFFYPFNHDWEISYCEFTDGHDGVYPNGRDIRFHHNWVDNMQDDGIYLSSPTPYICDELHIYQNLITRVLSAFAIHSRGGPEGDIYIYRNVVDLRQGAHRWRPAEKDPAGSIRAGQIFVKHGYELLGVESIYWYQNTFIASATGYSYVHSTLYNTSEATKRRVFNNLCVYLNNWPSADVVFRHAQMGTITHDIQIDGNLHWCANPDAKAPSDLLDRARTCKASELNKTNYPPGWASNSFVADPKFKTFSADPGAKNDYGLHKDSPAIGKGVILPKEWGDPLRPKDGARPDIGALPLGSEAPRFGRGGRVTLPVSGTPQPAE